MLYDAIEDGVTFEEADVVQFMREIIDGIIYLHNLGIVHRDLKPENILCTHDQPPFHVKISDFGLSSMSNIAEMKERRLLMSTMIGTPEFIAPEIANQQPYTEKVDIWALGMLCYNTIAHKLPLDENKDMILQLKKGLILSFPEKEWDAFGELSKSFMRAVLCLDPEKRLSPFGCLVHPWMDLKNEPRGVPTKVGAHGRFSSLFITPQFTDRDVEGESNPRMRARRRSVFVSGTWNAKRQWMVAFSAVAAFNRFNWLVHPRCSREDLHKYSQSHGPKKKHHEKVLPLEIDSMKQKISGMSDFSLSDEPSSSATMISSPASNRSSAGKKRMGVPAEPADGPRSLFGSMFKGLQKNKEGSRVDSGRISTSRNLEDADILEPYSAPAAMLVRRNDSSRKKKVVNALSKKASSKLTAPVRKLSKRLMKRSDSKREAGLSPLAAGALDLEIGLANLGITEVDDGDLLRLEGGGASTRTGPLSQQVSPESGESATSPCTPTHGRSLK
ncbi:Serine/threonine protein kinase [Gracilaria domingensis]|nr:Serine/threonine protein kinase [Gracilaria domingensis]